MTQLFPFLISNYNLEEDLSGSISLIRIMINKVMVARPNTIVSLFHEIISFNLSTNEGGALVGGLWKIIFGYGLVV